MDVFSQNKDYEKAAIYRDRILLLEIYKDLRALLALMEAGMLFTSQLNQTR